MSLSLFDCCLLDFWSCGTEQSRRQSREELGRRGKERRGEPSTPPRQQSTVVGVHEETKFRSQLAVSCAEQAQGNIEAEEEAGVLGFGEDSREMEEVQ